jgi:hypothetical protein
LDESTAIAVKYKIIPGALHNFAHSFLSLMNYVDGEYIIDVLLDVISAAPNHTLTIDWLADPPVSSVPLPRVVQKSVAYYRRWLPEHLEHHGIPITALRSLTTTVQGTRLGLSARAEAIDDRGKLHSGRVWP